MSLKRGVILAICYLFVANLSNADIESTGAFTKNGISCGQCTKHNLLGIPLACTNIDNIPVQGSTGHQGLTFDDWGGFWFVNNNNPPLIQKIDPTNGNVLKSANITVPNYAFDLDWYAGHFWLVSFTTSQITKWDTTWSTNLGTVNTTFGNQLRGLAFLGGYMWAFITGGAVNSGFLVRCDTTGREIARYPIGTIFQWPMHAAPAPWDPDTTFWVTDNNTANDIKRIKVSGSTVTLVETCPHPGSTLIPEGICFDPNHRIRTVSFRSTMIWRIDAGYPPVGVEKELSVNLPPGYSLASARPNPFGHKTEISFSIPKDGAVSLKLYNSQGQLIRTLASGNTKAGTHTVSWDGRTDSGSKVGSGIYFYRMESGNFSKTNKLSYVR